jgi:hypothetical protein
MHSACRRHSTEASFPVERRLMARFVTASVLFGILLVGRAAAAQNADPQAGAGPGVATITFTRNWWKASPPYYSVAVKSTGNTQYQSTPNSDQRTGEPYMVEFLASDSTRSKIFRLAQRLNFFQGKLTIRRSSTADVATNSLTFAEGSIQNQISYTSSKDPSLRQLTALFESISATLEFGRRLERLRQSNPQGLSAELKRAEQLSRRGRLVEFRAIAHVVQQIASDGSLSETSRRYARAILENSGSH